MKDKPAKPRSVFRGVNTPEHPRHPSAELKLEVLHRCFELGEDVKSIADEIGYSRASIYVWRRKYLERGVIALMNPEDDPRGELTAGIACSSQEITVLKAKLRDMQMQIDILAATIDVLKKDPGADQTYLRNSEKAVIIGALKYKYSLPELLIALNYPRSSYYYQRASERGNNKYQAVREHIRGIFTDNHSRYGYRRIHATLANEGIRLSEKVVRRLMRQESLTVPIKKARKYNSYKGEITPAVPNILARNFHSEKPNQKWVTDISEFAIPAGKVYLSSMIDCFDGMPVSWSISTAPNAGLVNTMLDDAISSLHEGEHPIVHSDRGCHYRWPGWIDRMERAHLIRSMSKKGCSPDNSACEGFFGRMKNEMFFGVSWSGVSLDDFIHELNDYMEWYCKKRIKVSLGGMSPLEYRIRLGLSA